MLSFQVAKFGLPLAAQTMDTPSPTGTQVLIKIEASGVCHSDLHIWEGHFDLGNGRKLPIGSPNILPLTLGHEIAGTVVAKGESATGVTIGDQRVVFPWIGCGACTYCQMGEEQLCLKSEALGVNRPGGYADHVLVPHPRYLLDYTGVPSELACTLACSGLTSYAALKKVGRLSQGQRLLIIGAGGVGMSAIRLAQEITGEAPVVADIDDQKLETARLAGAMGTINTTADGAAKQIIALTNGGAAAAIDFVGSESSTNLAISALRKAGKLFIVGLFGGNFQMPIPMFPLRSISVAGSYVGSLSEMHELVELAKAGRMQPIPVLKRPLKQAGQTLSDLKNGRIVGRVVLTP